MKLRIPLLVTFLCFFSYARCRKHTLLLTNDFRRYFSVSTFGFFKDGTMEVNVNEISFDPPLDSRASKFGFSLTRTVSNSVTPYLESHQDTCLLLDESLGNDENVNIVSFIVDTEQKLLLVNCSKNFKLGLGDLKTPLSASSASGGADAGGQRNRRNVGEHKHNMNSMTSDTFLMIRERRAIPPPSNPAPQNPALTPEQTKTSHDKNSQTVLLTNNDPKKEDKKPKLSDDVKQEPALPNEDEDEKIKDENNQDDFKSCSAVQIPVVIAKKGGIKTFSFKFEVKIMEENQSGLYSLYFHNCANYGGTHTPLTALNLSMNIKERNLSTFLSAGEIPLPQLFFIMSVTFFCLGCGWIYVLKRKTQETFKIHYLMGLLVFVKSLSLLFHGINYYFIARDGLHVEAWAIMYYITHLLKGALLFITIVLIGTGWAFIKHILSDKDKKIFMIVIPLQVLANVAEIIMEESEEGETQHNTWREVFILVDLLCCGAILFPVVWSIRHLQDASQTDGKAAINLEKLKLFRHFYVMIVCYIYFTRIIVFLLKITVPFQYEWLDEFFREVATLVFFLVTGYKFRPTYSNPYFRLSTDDDSLEMDEVITQSGLTEQVHKTRRSQKGNSSSSGKQESSHEYD